MKKSAWLLIILTIFPLMLFSQKTKRVEGSAQIEITDLMTRQEARDKVVEAAKLDALENAFGSVLVQGNSTYVTNLQTGLKSAETNVVFNTVANRLVKGEVVKVIKTDFQYPTGTKKVNGREEPVYEIKCDIEIEAREIISPKINFTSFTLNCPDQNCQTTEFNDGDKIYMYFSSPVSGYLSIFLTDEDTTQYLYPYDDMPSEFEGGVPVSADQKYILFSTKPEFNLFDDKIIRHKEYFLDSHTLQEMYIIYVIFSKTPINKPSVSDVQKLAGGDLPRSLKSEDFQNWLNKYKSFEKANVEVNSITVTVRKKK